jgi:hypothetical protein
MRGLKTLVSTTALLVGLALAPAAHPQISISIGVQPVCSYGYYGYAPYACAPMGYYGAGYFYNGIFLGMGPWAGWGYGHGWGSHRFVSDGGGRYHGGAGRVASSEGSGGRPASHPTAVRANAVSSHAGGAKPSAARAPTGASAPHVAATHVSAAHSSAPRGGGGATHSAGPAKAGGASHGGDAHK